MKNIFFLLTFLKIVCLVFSSSIEKECFAYNKVCNSLSLSHPKSFDYDFSRFKEFAIKTDDSLYASFYSDGFLDKYVGATRTIFSLYSLCHEGYPKCRLEGDSCPCNIAVKSYFEQQGYINFLGCRQATKTRKRKGQAEMFFYQSLLYTRFTDACNIVKLQDSPWIKQYWNSIRSESVKELILRSCSNLFSFSYNSYSSRSYSFTLKKPMSQKNSRPDRNCLRVGSFLKQFQFISNLKRQQSKSSTLFGVGLVAYCGACECCRNVIIPPIERQISEWNTPTPPTPTPSYTPTSTPTSTPYVPTSVSFASLGPWPTTSA